MSEYCLRWNNHRPNLVTVFSELLTSEALVDVTLATDGHYIHAHKLVLSACSVYFKDLFGANPCKHPIVILKDIRIEDLKTVIDFIYRGEVNVAQDRLQDVLRTAESLRIKGLAENPRSYDEMSSHSTRFLGSQTSRQRSSLTDSREQSLSVEGEDEGDAVTPPSNKKRKITTSHDSSESVQEEAEGEERGSCREVKDEPPDDHEGDRPSREGSEQDSASMGGSQEGAGGGEDSSTTTSTAAGTSTTDPALTAHPQGLANSLPAGRRLPRLAPAPLCTRHDSGAWGTHTHPGHVMRWIMLRLRLLLLLLLLLPLLCYHRYHCCCCCCCCCHSYHCCYCCYCCWLLSPPPQPLPPPPPPPPPLPPPPPPPLLLLLFSAPREGCGPWPGTPLPPPTQAGGGRGVVMVGSHTGPEWTLQQLSPWWASVLPALTRHQQQHHPHHRPPHFRPPPLHPSMAHLPSVRASLSAGGGVGGGGGGGGGGSAHHPGNNGTSGKGGEGGGRGGTNSSPRPVSRMPLDHMSLVAALGKEVSPQMVQALQAVAARRESFSSAAKLYAVSVTTLWRYSKKLGLSEPAHK